jgi:Transposase and inactivated derivatives
LRRAAAPDRRGCDRGTGIRAGTLHGEPDRPARLTCACCERFVQAPLPSRPIERGRPGPGLLAHVLVSKYADHLPLYRQSQIFDRKGLDLDRSTLADWVGKTTALLEPLAEAIGRHVLSAKAIFADDTPVRMLAPGTGRTQTARLWIYARDERPWGGDAPPAHGPHAPMTQTDPGMMLRQSSFDHLTGIATYVTEGRGGLFGEGVVRFDEIGTELAHDLRRELTIRPEDPPLRALRPDPKLRDRPRGLAHTGGNGDRNDLGYRPFPPDGAADRL